MQVCGLGGNWPLAKARGEGEAIFNAREMGQMGDFPVEVQGSWNLLEPCSRMGAADIAVWMPTSC